jgi:flagellar motor protein MotB
VLFQLNSDQLQPEGEALLRDLAKPLQVFLDQHDELLMVSGFTDDLPIQSGNRRYQDNWGLSAQRALTVTRTLINQGMPADQVFAAAFGPHQPVAPHNSDTTRAQNRRVELTTVPRQGTKVSTAQKHVEGADSNG